MSTTWLVTSCATIILFLASTAVLNVVADADLRMRRHGAAVGIGEGYSLSPRAFQVLQHRVVAAPLLAQRFDLLRQIFGARAAGSGLRRVALVEPFEIFVEPLVRRLDELLQRIAGEITVLVIHRFDPRSIHRQQFAPK